MGLPQLSSNVWTLFRKAFEVAPSHVVTRSGGYGLYDLRPRRLVELGYANGLRRALNGKREIWKCSFTGGWTERMFLGNPARQREVFRLSMMDYAAQIERGQITLPDGCTLAGALAILHLGGRGALKKFPELFPLTKRRYDAVSEMFGIDEDMATLALLALGTKRGDVHARAAWEAAAQLPLKSKMSEAIRVARKAS